MDATGFTRNEMEKTQTTGVTLKLVATTTKMFTEETHWDNHLYGSVNTINILLLDKWGIYATFMINNYNGGTHREENIQTVWINAG